MNYETVIKNLSEQMSASSNKTAETVVQEVQNQDDVLNMIALEIQRQGGQ
jgi:hypothetical protein